MKNKWVYLVLVLVAAFVGFYMFQKYRVAPRLTLETLKLVDLDEKPVSMQSFKGQKVVLCFSASWCGNCREELETLTRVKAAEELSDVTILVISDEPVEKVRGLKEKGYPFTFLKMQQSFSEIGIHAIPTSYILNKQLEVKKETVGYLNWKDPSTLQHLKKLMEG